MSFISYAQNFEDVMLWRALKHVENGFYIDVGANDPTIDSVTKAFYERGWQGINIEPLQSHYRDLEKERPRDINLCCASGETSGEIEVFECDVRGWASADQSVIDRHSSEGHEGVYHRVPVMTLAEICRQHVTGDIHFLKIDVEGFEAQVLAGMDFEQYRPWIVVVEATRPNSTVEVHEDWENRLLAVHYHFAYADGLNRYYVANEHAELAQNLKYPPNVFDDFVVAGHYQAGQWAEQAEQKLQQAEEQVRKAAEQVRQAEEQVRQADSHIQTLLNSVSWQITAPLRAVASLINKCLKKS